MYLMSSQNNKVFLFEVFIIKTKKNHSKIIEYQNLLNNNKNIINLFPGIISF